ncbi:MAG: hypothetical protein A3F18_05090 [Legionellales bacterium RIFCSPHIGHO2_12_FULL_37_14]|nr:MAG: hypothetical protein A3F18_05090 [Legionellales bacterium RIFCSPHIGHO2_12_FULL_37_14]
MIRKILGVSIFISSFAAFACPNALPVDDVNFCPSFKKAAVCHCTASGLPESLCQDMHILYERMIIMFKSLERACEFQHYTSKQDCIDNWRCYLVGGEDSLGRACSSTKLPCE